MHFSFGTKQGRGEEEARVKTGPKRLGVKLTQTRGKREWERDPQKVTCNPAKSPLAVVSSHSHLARAAIKKCQVVPKFVPIC